MSDLPIVNSPASPAGVDVPAAGPAARPFGAYVFRVEAIAQHPRGENLTLVSLAGHGEHLVANKLEDGSWRYRAGDLAVLMPVGSVLPHWLLKDMDALREDSKGKIVGALGGNKGNRITPRTFAETPSNGMLRKCKAVPGDAGEPTRWYVAGENGEDVLVAEGQDVTALLGIVQHGA